MKLSNTMFWTTGDGRKILLEELTQQHLSNIIWYFEVFFSEKMPHIQEQLDKRFSGELLSWKPLPIPNEVQNIAKLTVCKIADNGDIIYLGKTIGTIAHIPNWKDQTEII